MVAPQRRAVGIHCGGRLSRLAKASPLAVCASPSSACGRVPQFVTAIIYKRSKCGCNRGRGRCWSRRNREGEVEAAEVTGISTNGKLASAGWRSAADVRPRGIHHCTSWLIYHVAFFVSVTAVLGYHCSCLSHYNIWPDAGDCAGCGPNRYRLRTARSCLVAYSSRPLNDFVNTGKRRHLDRTFVLVHATLLVLLPLCAQPPP